MHIVWNTAERVVLKKDSYNTSTTECLKILHWLPTKERINYKICNLVHNWLHGKAPKYLQDLINIKKTKWAGLRSELKEMLLDIPPTKRKTFTSRSFSVYGPTLWNSLPNHLWTCTHYDKFRGLLKTHLFKKTYN